MEGLGLFRDLKPPKCVIYTTLNIESVLYVHRSFTMGTWLQAFCMYVQDRDTKDIINIWA